MTARVSNALSQNGFAGIYNILATPFSADEALDEDGIRRLVTATCRAGVDGITILGVAGEAHKLDAAERGRVTSIAIEAADGAIPVIVGVSHDRTEDAIEAARAAEGEGATGVMVAPPRGSRAGEELTAHFERIAAAVEMPIVLQDYPAVTGVELSVEEIAELVARVPAITTIKLESTPTPRQTAKAVAALGEDISVLGGMGGLYFLQELRRGARGTMTGFSYTEALVSIWRSWQEGDVTAAAATFYEYLPLLHLEGQPGVGLAIRKESLRRRGLIEHALLRQPAAGLDAETADELSALTRDLGVVAKFDGRVP